jgi:hypothetical protein
MKEFKIRKLKKNATSAGHSGKHLLVIAAKHRKMNRHFEACSTA